jgi:hypothetical protein
VRLALTTTLWKVIEESLNTQVKKQVSRDRGPLVAVKQQADHGYRCSDCVTSDFIRQVFYVENLTFSKEF